MKHAKITQTNFYDFFTFDVTSTEQFTNFSTTETTSQKHFLNPFYACRPRRGYGIFSDHLNVWKLQEEPADYSRKDIAVAYRLGGGY